MSSLIYSGEVAIYKQRDRRTNWQTHKQIKLFLYTLEICFIGGMGKRWWQTIYKTQWNYNSFRLPRFSFIFCTESVSTINRVNYQPEDSLHIKPVFQTNLSPQSYSISTLLIRCCPVSTSSSTSVHVTPYEKQYGSVVPIWN